MQKGIIRLDNQPYIIASGAVVGKKEHDGPLGRHFAAFDETDTFGMPTWEQSESEMQRLALNRALDSSGMKIHDIDAIFAEISSINAHRADMGSRISTRLSLACLARARQ